MKKLYIVTFVVILALCGCSNNTNKYVEKMDAIIEESTTSYYTAEELVRDYAVKDEEAAEYLNYVKTQLAQFKQFDEYNSLNWSSFDSIKSVYWLDTGKINNLPEGVNLDGYDAVYSKSLAGVIFYPAISGYSEEQKFHVTTHELCHALLESKGDQRQNSFIIEGEVEQLALSFSMSLGMKPDPTYPNGILTAAWLNGLFGEKKVHEAIINNNLDTIIDEVAGDRACHKINLGGYMAESNIKPEIGRNAEIEVLCHISKALDKTNVGERCLKNFSDIFEDVDVSYFNIILSS